MKLHVFATKHKTNTYSEDCLDLELNKFRRQFCFSTVESVFTQSPRIKTTKKLAAMLVYFQKNIFKILLSRYTNMAAMTSHANALYMS